MKIYLVGGAVRDLLLGLKPKDLDYVVVGATEDEMLKKGLTKVGDSFPVFIHPKTRFEYALARKEIKTGKGHKGFNFDFSPEITLEEDLYRRDITINALAKDEDTGEIFDPYGGKEDLEKKIIKHVSNHFVEDPLRVLRVARFFSQLEGFKIHPSTLNLMTEMTKSGELQGLSKERVFNEIEKALLSLNPILFFQCLKKIGALIIFFPLFQEYKDDDYSLLEFGRSHTKDLSLLFGLILYPIISNPQKSSSKEKEIESFFSSIMAPKKIQSVSLLLLHFPIWWNEKNLNKNSEILELIKKGGFLKEHKEKFFSQFLEISEIIFKYFKNLSTSPEKKEFYPGILFQKIVSSLRSLDYSSEIKNNEGKEISKAIEKKQLEKISEILRERV